MNECFDIDGKKLNRGFYTHIQFDMRDPKIRSEKGIYLFIGHYDEKSGFPIFEKLDNLNNKTRLIIPDFMCKDFKYLDKQNIKDKLEKLEEEVSWYKSNIYSGTY